MSAVTHAFVPTTSGVAGMRDLERADIEAIVAYWHRGGADLEFLGIDAARLTDEAGTFARFERALRTGERNNATSLLPSRSMA